VANWVVNTTPDDIQERAIKKAKSCILDTIGVTIAGAKDKSGEIITEYVNNISEKQQCRLIGTSLKTSPPLAALANGAMGHALDFDDISYTYLGHPSVSVLPAALALGESVNVTGLDLIVAYIIGTEVACKLGTAISHKLSSNGWHTGSLIGTFGATAASGKILRLNEDQMAYALAITASLISGIKGNIGTMTKPFQVGHSAENGVVSALLAKRGMTGSLDIFERDYGFCDVFKVSNKFESLSKMGRPFDVDIPGFIPKEFPSCSASHAAINAAIKLVCEYQIEPGQVKKINCATTPLVLSSLLYSMPHDSIQARFSMQFCLATVILGRGEIKLSDFRDEMVRNKKTIEMMRKVNLRVSPEFERKGFAPSYGPEAAIVEIILKNGVKYKNKKLFADWRADNPPSFESLIKKYKDCASFILSPMKLELSIEQIKKLEQLKSIRNLLDSITI